MLLLALAVPMVAALRLVAPIEQTMVLIAPAMAVCALLGWQAGGRFWLAAIWMGLAVWILSTSIPGAGAFDPLARGWSVVLAASFGIVGAVAPGRPFFTRALSATGLTFAVALAVVLGMRVPPTVIARNVSGEITRRVEATEAEWRVREASPEWGAFTAQYPAAAEMVAQGEAQVRAVKPFSITFFPALLALESLAALGLAWSLYHRASRARIGPPMRPVREFRF
ncbi:MAG: hypothetical protein ABIZ91_18035, partial [Gemmatimonadaceae bacterium]